jgi:hypothetical protein
MAITGSLAEKKSEEIGLIPIVITSVLILVAFVVVHMFDKGR